MFHMLSCFDLIDGVSIDEFRKYNADFLLHMKEQGLVDSFGAIGKRNKHPVMDTDNNRDQKFFYIMTFLDEKQCNRAVDCISSQSEPENTIHQNMIAKTKNHTFICWEDC